MNIGTNGPNPLSKQQLQTLVKSSLDKLQSVKENLPETPLRAIHNPDSFEHFDWYEGSIGDTGFTQVGRHRSDFWGVTSLVCRGPGSQEMAVTFKDAPPPPMDEEERERCAQMSFLENLERGGEQLIKAFKAIARGEKPEPSAPRYSTLEFSVGNPDGISRFTYHHDSTVTCDLLDGKEVDICLADQKLPPFEVWQVTQ